MICPRRSTLNLFILTTILEGKILVNHHNVGYDTTIMMSKQEITGMLYRTPPLAEPELAVLAQIDGLRESLRIYLHEPRRWSGSLRRMAFARVIQGSNTIEGYSAALDDAAAVALGEEPLDADTETRLALEGYCDAMTFVLQQAEESDFMYTEGMLKAIHFMMTSHDLKKRPGQWRRGAVYVRNDQTGEIVYEGPDIDRVPSLIAALTAQLNSAADAAPAMVLAGMAHLNLVMIHPFADGNGRMARVLQSLVMVRGGILTPTFVSIEEYLGRNTQSYYDILAEVGNGAWHPERDALPWVRYILTAHLRQARTMLQRIKDSERLWGELEALVKEHGLPERTIAGLFDAAMGYRLRRGTYQAMSEEPIQDETATRDLRRLTDSGLLRRLGEKKGTYYLASEKLGSIWLAIKAGHAPRDESDPFAGS
jgi:Fic family protein